MESCAWLNYYLHIKNVKEVAHMTLGHQVSISDNFVIFKNNFDLGIHRYQFMNTER